MQNPKELVVKALKQWLQGKNLNVDFEVSLVSEQKFGDLSSNIALICSKNLNSNPRQTAEEITFFLKQQQEVNQVFNKIEVAGPGFINLFLSSKYLYGLLEKIARSEKLIGLSNNKSPQKVIVEFGDPNPFKEIHIGHLRNFCIGETFCKLLESQGNNVTRANYQGDVGLHVAKTLWGLLKRQERFLDEGLSEDEKVKILAESYVEGATEFETNEEVKQEMIEINKKIYTIVSHSEPSGEESQTEILHAVQDDIIKRLWEEGRKVSLEHFEELYKRIGVRYDKYYFESVTAKRGREIVLSHVDDGVFERNEGAVVYRGEQDGLHTRVFLTSQDYATYEGKDLALAIMKNEDDAYDESVILTGNEQLEYFQVMLAALSKIAPELASKTRHLTFGHVRLKEGKMSSRTGDVITASWLLDESVNRVKQAFADMDYDTAEKVGVGAVKYSMLKFSIPSDIHFSFEESISLEGNSGPYLQYTYVRTQSVLDKSSSRHSERSEESQAENLFYKATRYSIPSRRSQDDGLETEESELIRFLSQFEYHLEIAAEGFAPNLLCNYLFELAQKFNLFYQKHKIIGSEKEVFRLQLTKAVGNVLKSGLHALGIETVEKM